MEVLLLVRVKFARVVNRYCSCESIVQFAIGEGIGLCYPFMQNQNSIPQVVYRFLEHFKNSLNASLIGVRQDGVLGLVD